jgi:hypothetical protein
MTTVFQKYATAIFSLAVLVLGAVQAAAAAGFTDTEIWQITALGIGGVITFVVPIVKGKWGGVLKTGFSILGAAGALVVPYFIDQNITTEGLLLVVIGVINVFATQLGVIIRKDPIEVPKDGVLNQFNHYESTGSPVIAVPAGVVTNDAPQD